MGKKAIFQTVGAVMLGLNVAVPMVLDARGLFPHWNWQYHVLIGFIAFCVFIGWIIFSKQSQINKYESGRPQLTIGDKTSLTRDVREKEHKVIFGLHMYHQNSGLKPAYQLRIRVGYALEGKPEGFILFSENTSSNPVYPDGSQWGIQHTFEQQYEIKDGQNILKATRGVLIHCVLDYQDAPTKGKAYHEEWWYSYNFERQSLSALSIPRKKELEPYVKLAYQREGSTW